MSQANPTIAQDLYKKISGVWMGLVVQFVLGMIIRLYSESPGDMEFAAESMLVKVAFVAHVVNGALLIYASIRILITAIKSQVTRWRDAAVAGLFGILVAGSSGLINVILARLPKGAGSLIMAMGFLTAFVSYGVFFLFIQHLTRLENSESE